MGNSTPSHLPASSEPVAISAMNHIPKIPTLMEIAHRLNIKAGEAIPQPDEFVYQIQKLIEDSINGRW